MFSKIQKPLSFISITTALLHLNISPTVVDSFRRDLAPMPNLHFCSSKWQMRSRCSWSQRHKQRKPLIKTVMIQYFLLHFRIQVIHVSSSSGNSVAWLSKVQILIYPNPDYHQVFSVLPTARKMLFTVNLLTLWWQLVLKAGLMA